VCTHSVLLRIDNTKTKRYLFGNFIDDLVLDEIDDADQTSNEDNADEDDDADVHPNVDATLNVETVLAGNVMRRQ